MSNQSVIHSEVDFDLEGKHLGYLRLPHSVHRSAYGWIPIPVASIKNGVGPKVVLMAGTHGDEYEGQIILSQLIRQIKPEQISGQIIIVPMSNFPAAQAGLRISPIDDLNLNRIFPGDARGTPSEMIAHYIETILLKDADYFVDIHSGGTSLEYLPLAMYEEASFDHSKQCIQVMLDSLALPYSLLCPGSDTLGWFTTSAAHRNKACALTIELGGGGRVNRDYIVLFQQSLLRMLRAIGSWSEDVAVTNTKTQYVISSKEHKVYAASAGLFEPLVKLGDIVSANETVAYLHDPSTPGSEPVKVTTSISGMVLCQRMLAQVQRGDCLFELVIEINSPFVD